ncbi:potassium-transporting ATPase subunit C [Niabella beijingensis]|uniref:potassium-transporting ATPase subunit C n=1 Tax=Niabella beijingensis TaxID=2872700 RepID=UPI001CBBC13D|nr:potassium-transporting ATPase subunit C [Niabella beijingensis]MBZ4192294.1 potassium-transporting ATPase subunit C [Niabella beijingensis]
MKHIIPAIRLTLILMVLCVVVYSLLLSGFAQLTPEKGKGEKISGRNGKSYYANIGQRFDSVIYFSSRPSAVAYNAAGSGGSNKGPNNPDYLKEVQQRVEDFKQKNPGAAIPADIVTASGSGLDPDISVAAANAQVVRIATARKLSQQTVQELVNKHIDRPVLGPQKINVLKLNIDLDQLGH